MNPSGGQIFSARYLAAAWLRDCKRGRCWPGPCWLRLAWSDARSGPVGRVPTNGNGRASHAQNQVDGCRASLVLLFVTELIGRYIDIH